MEGAARQVLSREWGCLQEGLIARSYPICPSLLPSFSPTSFCGVHTPFTAFLFQRALFYISQTHHKSVHNDAAPLTPRVWRGQGWVCSPALHKLRWLRPSDVTGGASQAATHQQLQGPRTSAQPEKPSQPPGRIPRRSPPSLEALPRCESMLGTSLRTCPPHWTLLITLLG